MFGLSRWSPFDDISNFQREMDRVFNQFWTDLPTRTARNTGAFQVTASDDAWRLDIPLPGVDPKDVNLQVAGNTLNIRAELPEDKGGNATRYEQTVTLPQFLDIDKLTASHYHGMLRLSLPLKEAVRPRRIQIQTEGAGTETRQLAGSAAGGR
jgi:HSP20 family protein